MGKAGLGGGVANYLAGRLAEEQRTDIDARRAQAAVAVGEDLVHLDPE